ncbi:MAG: hypothetical protein UR68_C0038G0011 [Candidatus Roizmanbacteria bacterium GW2011_GWA2_35_19]|uniref:Peptidase S1 domain-containing protein n=2 Tax=Candidatus Roizmaniibacteriota TaxID=1752723 RepID=A0A0G0BMU4_9BACT|nr:MAG: hypothetical protein UR63_C0004G0036 [Candidatus Roizmanbacteria bacterium GW2011_GWC2_35_12]KKP70824.1 MAG: hypothetical protein UR68_C0038G0011 [Candidatus Roizmanbacteria bacterium GW2011_GWA2_35_19]
MFLMTSSFCVDKKFFLLIFVILLIGFFSVIYKINSKNLTYKTKASTPQIFGGQPADPGEWPFVVVLYDKTLFGKGIIGTLKNTQFCTGFLISNSWVITAAHCLYKKEGDFSKLFVYNKFDKKSNDFIGVAVGFDNINTTKVGQKQALRDIEGYVIYEGFNYKYRYKNTLDFSEYKDMRVFHNDDIALIRIKPLDDSVNFKTISITNDKNLIVPTTYVEILGWGYTEKAKPDVLYEGINKIDSNRRSNNNIIVNEITIIDSAARPNQGDSGGPMLTYNNNEWFAIGIASSENSGLPQSYYTNLIEHYPWINLVTKIEEGQGSFIGKSPEW